jgi:5-formyltetrahydrofolate cyclo-ligase
LSEPSTAKAVLRREIIARRDALSAEMRVAFSARITVHLQGLPAFQSARALLGYLSFGTEYQTDRLLATRLANGLPLGLPRINRIRRELEIFLVGDLQTDTAPGVWGIREPQPERCAPAELEKFDLILVPGVAFTAAGDRLGYGGGYYDRLLARWPHPRPRLVAAAFSVQIVPAIPTTVSDVPVDCLVTEDGVIDTCTSSSRRFTP